MTDFLHPDASAGNAPKLSVADIPAHLPILPLSDVVVFPHMIAPLLVTSPHSISLVDDVVAGDRLIGVTLQKNPDDEHPRGDQLQQVGCVARVNRMLKFPDDSVRVLIQGLKRMRLSEFVGEKPYLVANVTPLEDEVRAGLELTAFARNVSKQFQEIVELAPNLPDELKVAVLNIDDPSKKYPLQTWPGEYHGLHLISIMYAAFQQFAPGTDVGIDLSQEYRLAVGK